LLTGYIRSIPIFARDLKPPPPGGGGPPPAHDEPFEQSISPKKIGYFICRYDRRHGNGLDLPLHVFLFFWFPPTPGPIAAAGI